MLVRCLFASRPAGPSHRPALDALLAQARHNNAPRGITGILCHTDRLFVQVLEGGRETVGALFATILADERHRDVCLLGFEETCERRFGRWAMGEVELARVNQALLLKYSAAAQFDPFTMPAAATVALLDELAATAAIVNRGGTEPV